MNQPKHPQKEWHALDQVNRQLLRECGFGDMTLSKFLGWVKEPIFQQFTKRMRANNGLPSLQVNLQKFRVEFDFKFLKPILWEAQQRSLPRERRIRKIQPTQTLAKVLNNV